MGIIFVFSTIISKDTFKDRKYICNYLQNTKQHSWALSHQDSLSAQVYQIFFSARIIMPVNETTYQTKHNTWEKFYFTAEVTGVGIQLHWNSQKDNSKTFAQDKDEYHFSYPTWDTTCSENFHLKICFKFIKSRTTRLLDSFFFLLLDPSHLYTLSCSPLSLRLCGLTRLQRRNDSVHIMYNSFVQHYGNVSMIVYFKI